MWLGQISKTLQRRVKLYLMDTLTLVTLSCDSNYTTSKIVTGSQNIDAALAAIRANATSTSAPKPSAGVPAAPGAPPLPTTPDYASEDEPTLTYTLQTLTADAEAYSKTINDAWSLLAGCTTN